MSELVTTGNPDARPEPINIDTFEGEYVRFMRGKLPSIVLDMPEGFRRGTHVHLQVEARVRHVNYPESTSKEHRGELVREHLFAIEEVTLIGALSAAEADPGVGGSAAATPAKKAGEVHYISSLPRDCYYDAANTQVVHRGGCAICKDIDEEGEHDAGF